MSRKRKASSVDFDFGIGEIVPSTQEAYHYGEFDGAVSKAEKESLAQFKNTVRAVLDRRLKDDEQFPTDGEVFIFIIQYFAVESEYTRRDIDNMAKTILDVLKGRFYRDDSQVKTLLIGKKIERRVPQNFAYVAIKKLSAVQDVDALKISGLERSVTMFQELKSKGIL
ncbi:MAG: RusA family crossover junction endodeoxyribonuclease [Candidatus Kerfeldbacteria bacterium]|nr:RusA family crossover junction endodeoxyribonuclease [Candidatus Kerfeldbacteria bacterium]